MAITSTELNSDGGAGGSNVFYTDENGVTQEASFSGRSTTLDAAVKAVSGQQVVATKAFTDSTNCNHNDTHTSAVKVYVADDYRSDGLQADGTGFIFSGTYENYKLSTTFVGVSFTGTKFELNSSGGTVTYMIEGCQYSSPNEAIRVNESFGAGIAGTIRNCVVYGAVSGFETGIRIRMPDNASYEFTIENTSIFIPSGTYFGVWADITTRVICKNVMVLHKGTGNCFNGTFGASSDNNISSDTTAVGTTTYKSVTIADTILDDTDDAADLHWLDSATAANYIGSDESGSFTQDFDLNTRASWNIGAFDVGGGGGGGGDDPRPRGLTNMSLNDFGRLGT